MKTCTYARSRAVGGPAGWIPALVVGAGRGAYRGSCRIHRRTSYRHPARTMVWFPWSESVSEPGRRCHNPLYSFLPSDRWGRGRETSFIGFRRGAARGYRSRAVPAALAAGVVKG